MNCQVTYMFVSCTQVMVSCGVYTPKDACAPSPYLLYSNGIEELHHVAHCVAGCTPGQCRSARSMENLNFQPLTQGLSLRFVETCWLGFRHVSYKH